MLTVYIVQISLLASRAICLTFQNKIAHQLLFHLVQLASWCILTCAWKYFYCSHNRTLFSLAQKNHWLENTSRGKRNHQKFYLVTSIEHSKRKTFKMWAHFLLFFFVSLFFNSCITVFNTKFTDSWVLSLTKIRQNFSGVLLVSQEFQLLSLTWIFSSLVHQQITQMIFVHRRMDFSFCLFDLRITINFFLRHFLFSRLEHQNNSNKVHFCHFRGTLGLLTQLTVGANQWWNQI